MMYAKGSPGDVYHLLTPDEKQTTCGLSAVPVVIDRVANTSDLHLTFNRPTNGKLCDDCAKWERKRIVG
jgi:hypothetical protein